MILVLDQAPAVCPDIEAKFTSLEVPEKIVKQTDIEVAVPENDAISLVLITTTQVDVECYNLLHEVKRTYPTVPRIVICKQEPHHSQVNNLLNANDICLPANSINHATLALALKQAGYIREGAIQLDYTTLFNSNPLPMFIIDRATKAFIHVNKAAVERYGYSLEEFKQRSLEDIRPKEDIPLLHKLFQQDYKEGFYNHGLIQHKAKDGQVFYVDIYIHTTMLQKRRVQVAIAIDVDKQAKANLEKEKLSGELERQQQRINYILNSVNEAIWTRDGDTLELLEINKACENIYGYTVAEVMNDPTLLNGVLHPDDTERIMQDLEQIRKSGNGDLQYRIVDKNGKVKNLVSRSVYYKDPESGRNILSGITIDITELKKTQRKLNEKAQELNMILNSITDGFFRVDKDWKFTFINKTFEEICDTKKEDILGKSYWEQFPNAMDGIFYREYTLALRTQQPRHFEEFATSINKWVLVNVYPSPNGLSIFFTDITEEYELREKIRRSELNLRTIINNTDDIIWAVDTDLNIVYANNEFNNRIADIIERTPQVGECALFDFMPADVEQRYRDHYSRALAGEHVYHVEEHTLRDKTSYLETNYYPIAENGVVTGISCYMRDVTERRNYIKKIEDANTRLQEIAWLQSHKVRSHTATILGMVQLYNADTPDSPDNSNVIQGIKEAAEYLDNVIREITEKTNLQDQNT